MNAKTITTLEDLKKIQFGDFESLNELVIDLPNSDEINRRLTERVQALLTKNQIAKRNFKCLRQDYFRPSESYSLSHPLFLLFVVVPLVFFKNRKEKRNTQKEIKTNYETFDNLKKKVLQAYETVTGEGPYRSAQLKVDF